MATLYTVEINAASLAELVKKLRSARGISQKELGDETNTDESTISRIESGERSIPPTPSQGFALRAFT